MRKELKKGGEGRERIEGGKGRRGGREGEEGREGKRVVPPRFKLGPPASLGLATALQCCASYFKK
jgi:hypothetical protein